MSSSPSLEDVAAYAMEHGCGVAEAHREIAYIKSLEQPSTPAPDNENWANASSPKLRERQMKPLRDALDARGMTRQELAALTGHKYGRLCAMVNGRARMRKFDLAVVADALDLPPDLLIDLDPEGAGRQREMQRITSRAEAAGVRVSWRDSIGGEGGGELAAVIWQDLDNDQWSLGLNRGTPWRQLVWCADWLWIRFDAADEHKWFVTPAKRGRKPLPPRREVGIKPTSAPRSLEWQ